MASTDARPIPIKNTAYRVTFPILDADGDLVTGASGLDSEVSKDAGTFADCTNEATEIATSSGMYYLDLTSTEMNADCVAIIVKTSTSGAKTVPIVLYPQESGDIKVDIQSAAGTAWASGAITAASIATDAITAAKIAADAIGASELAADAVTEIWNGNPNLVRSATAQGGSANSITLDASASATNGLYDPSLIVITGGTGAGQARLITDYNGTTKVAVVNRDWRTTPDNTSVFRIIAAPNMVSLNEGLAQGGGASTITLNALASATNDAYVGQCIWITTGTGQDQARIITAYNGTTKVATVDESWVTNPTSSSGYMLIPYGRSYIVGGRTNAIDSGIIDSSAGTELADALLDRSAGVETGLTVRQAFRLIASVLFGKASGLATTTAVYRDFGDTKDRISATVDASGNRTAVTRDAT